MIPFDVGDEVAAGWQIGSLVFAALYNLDANRSEVEFEGAGKLTGVVTDTLVSPVLRIEDLDLIRRDVPVDEQEAVKARIVVWPCFETSGRHEELLEAISVTQLL